jgi:hypothetical protein
MALSRNACSYWSSPRSRSQAAISILPSCNGLASIR